MNMNDEVRKYLVNFLNKVLDQSYTRNEWENFSYNVYQNNELEKARKKAINIISKNLEPNGFKMKAMSQETKDSIQELINGFD